MNIIRRIFGRSESVRPAKLLGDGSYSCQVVGESNYQDTLEYLNGGRSDESAETEIRALVVPDPSNPHDSNAVRIQVQGRLVGYLGRADAARYQRELSNLKLSGQTLACEAMIRGGWIRDDGDYGHFGIFLDIVWPLSVLPER
jgi:hypothetical protein